MVGDVLHESMIFVESFEDVTSKLSVCVSFLILMNIRPKLFFNHIGSIQCSQDEFMDRMKRLTSDVFFQLQTWLSLRRSTVPQTYGYHFDQVSKIPDDPFEGKAYHAPGLLYVFLNTEEMLSPSENQLSHTIAGHRIDILKYDNGHWMRYGQDDEVKIVTEQEGSTRS
ncbi:hypothetical protein ASPBRDRAFT_190511 [Aspergillus brasiliensis CBS 101740]|uniref:Uncharacterized protein n=1 Tax=Aspergillus brasiliensis (strain CBS 101740 / IMI 381727 / IBT 21946) TaxID=767769 RepID=A0A1L9UZT4_ASPBC|nr:hypothetical protein ASPBRDRAFT_190511 [Aspergillus brasiliensis CBS 101740]